VASHLPKGAGGLAPRAAEHHDLNCEQQPERIPAVLALHRRRPFVHYRGGAELFAERGLDAEPDRADAPVAVIMAFTDLVLGDLVHAVRHSCAACDPPVNAVVPGAGLGRPDLRDRCRREQRRRYLVDLAAIEIRQHQAGKQRRQ